jgi:uncharacterized protein YraI
MKHLGPLLLSAMAAWALPYTAQAQAQVAYTAKTVNVRAGPARDYPLVAVLPPRYQVIVQGCLPDYTWCDVVAGPSRGWMYAGNINYAYQNTYVPVLNYGAVIGIGVLAFVLDDYWGRHYQHRPWYGERRRWMNRPVPPVHRYDRPVPGRGMIAPRAAPHPDGVPRRHDGNPSGAVISGARPAPQQPGAQRHPPQRISPRPQGQAAPHGGGPGSTPRDGRGQGRRPEQ